MRLWFAASAKWRQWDTSLPVAGHVVFVLSTTVKLALAVGFYLTFRDLSRRLHRIEGVAADASKEVQNLEFLVNVSHVLQRLREAEHKADTLSTTVAGMNSTMVQLRRDMKGLQQQLNRINTTLQEVALRTQRLNNSDVRGALRSLCGAVNWVHPGAWQR